MTERYSIESNGDTWSGNDYHLVLIGSSETQLRSSSAEINETPPRDSPLISGGMERARDGARVYVTSDRFESVSLTGKVSVVDEVGKPNFKISPSGKRLAYTSLDGASIFIQTIGKSERQSAPIYKVQDPGENEVRSLDWISEDEIVLIEQQNAPQNASQSSLYPLKSTIKVLNTVNGNLKTVLQTADQEILSDISVSPTGEKAIVLFRVGPTNVQLPSGAGVQAKPAVLDLITGNLSKPPMPKMYEEWTFSQPDW